MHTSGKDFRILSFYLIAFLLMLQACKGQENRSLNSSPRYAPARLDSNLNFSSRINLIFQDSQDNLWFVSHQDGVVKYDGEIFSYFTEEQGLPPVRAIYEGPKGQMYFGIQDGLRILEGKKIRHISAETESIPIKDSFPFAKENYEGAWKAEREHFWFSAFNRNGVYRYDGNKLQHLTLPVPADYPDFSQTNGFLEGIGYDIYAVYDIYTDPEGVMWFGTTQAGLFRYDGKSLEWVNEAYEKGVIRATFKDSNGTIWFGNNPEGLYQYKNGRMINFTEERKLGEEGVASALAIEEDAEGNIWIATFSNGLWKYDPSLDTLKNSPIKKNSKILKHFAKEDGLGTNYISTLFSDKEGKLWIGTGAGEIFSYNGKGFDKLN